MLLREDMAGRAAAAEFGGLTGGQAAALTGVTKFDRPAALSEFQRKVTPYEKAALMSDLFSADDGKLEGSCTDHVGAAGVEGAHGEGKVALQHHSKQQQPSRQQQQREEQCGGSVQPLAIRPGAALSSERMAILEATGLQAGQLDAAAAAAQGRLQ